MNKYQLLKKYQEIIFIFIKNGILSYMLIRDIEMYENYLSLDDNMNKELKYMLLADEYELSPDRIKQIIYQMQKEIN
jgi:hypothetical protein